MMPYLQVFSEGEVLRNGTSSRLRKGLLIPLGYFLISVNFVLMGLMSASTSPMLALLLFAGLFSYWILIFKNVFRRNDVEADIPGDTFK